MERRAITVRGIVQGVGFRPFVYRLASRLGLRGFVVNQTADVVIEIEGATTSLDRFLNELQDTLPKPACILEISCESRTPKHDESFLIAPSESGALCEVLVSPDLATCAECRRELFDPADRRFRYPFLNCTQCGPRLTIIAGVPYDRLQTTMASFFMCSVCQAEYDDPGNRRFHAQPNACPTCGPRLEARTSTGETLSIRDPIQWFADVLTAGKIGALKGLGGVHLVCDASNRTAVATLRRRKHREEKPLAVMVRDIDAARALCVVTDAEAQLLQSPRAPIVLLRKCDAVRIASEVAWGNPLLGVMLPYTPLHWLLIDALPGMPLVMTSGNRSEEPIAYHNDETIHQLSGIADVFLLHNRPIHIRCDDSVTRILDQQEAPLRRSRGYAPYPLNLPVPCSIPLLAVGAQQKVTFGLSRGHQAVLSQHMGDLDHLSAYQAFVRDIAISEQLFQVKPQCLVHDLNPDYASTRYAKDRAHAEGLTLLAVGHHHAHLASCMAEHGLDEPVIGVTFDGAGLGPDGTIWGGEFLVGDYQDYWRAGHLRTVRMPGGEKAIREPWRMAAAHLLDAEIGPAPLAERIDARALTTVHALLLRKVNAPPTSSMGRLFDAVASLCGIRDFASYEGQAAVELEWLATDEPAALPYPFSMATPHAPKARKPLVIDTRPLVSAVHEGVCRKERPRSIARRFHATVVKIIAESCNRIREATGIEAVVLTGGVFHNALVTREASARLRGDGFRVYRHRLVPAGDGGLCLGQLAIAARLLTRKDGPCTNCPSR